MANNVKPGDLAYLTRCLYHPSNVGAVVEVLRPRSIYSGVQMWFVKTSRVMISDYGKTIQSGQEFVCGDDQLKKISGDDIQTGIDTTVPIKNRISLPSIGKTKEIV